MSGEREGVAALKRRALTVEDRGPARILRLNRPRALNAVDSAMLETLASAAIAADEDPSIAAVVLVGEGRSFCAGADLKEVIGIRQDRPALEAYFEQWQRTGAALEQLGKPVIAAVHGYVMAGGLELLLCCDLAIAAENVQIGDAHAGRGLIPGGGGTQRLVRTIGMRRALEMMLAGRTLTATEALAFGLVNSVVADDSLLDSALALVDRLTTMGSEALAGIKKLARAGQDASLADGLRMERELVVEHMVHSEEVTEGIRSFIEKRPPRWAQR